MGLGVEAASAASVTARRREAPMSIQNRNYLKLRRLLPNLDQLQGDDCVRLGTDGRNPVSVIVQPCEGEQRLLTVAHYFDLDGELVANPGMSLLVDLAAGTVEALSYQDRSRYTHRRDGDYHGARLDDFLSLWLSNLFEQGYRVAVG